MKKFLNYDKAKAAFEEGKTVLVSGTLLVYDKNNRQVDKKYDVSTIFTINRHLEWEIIE